MNDELENGPEEPEPKDEVKPIRNYLNFSNLEGVSMNSGNRPSKRRLKPKKKMDFTERLRSVHGMTSTRIKKSI